MPSRIHVARLDRIHVARLEVKQIQHLVHLMKNSNKVVNHTYVSFLLTFLPYRLTNHSLRSRLNNSRYLLGVVAGFSATTEKRVCVLATHVTRKSVNSLHLETNQ